MRTGLFDIENWREIGATLARNKTRTFLTAFGIFWGTAMLAMLLGGERGLHAQLMSNFEGFATNCAVMFPNRRTISWQGFNKGTNWTLNQKDREAMRLIPGMDAVSVTNSLPAVSVSYGKNSTNCGVQGADDEFVRVFMPTVYEGRFINNADQTDARKVAVVGRKIADKVFPDGDAVGKFVNVGGIYYLVVGIAGQTSEVSVGGNKVDEVVTIPMSTLVKMANLGDDLGGVMFTAKQGVSPSSLKPRIQHILYRNHSVAPDDDQALFFFVVSEQFAMVDNLFLGLKLLAIFVGVGTLIAGIIGVGNIMWVIVKERTQEIGIRRAIGAKPRDIVVQVLSEGLVLTAVAGTAGIVPAAAVLQTATHFSGQPYQMGFTEAIAIVVIFMVLGVSASIVPSLKAMKIKPIEAINDK